MSFFRVVEPNVGAVSIPDLGISIAQNSAVVLSNQFSVSDLYLSADLEALIIAGSLEVEIDYGLGYSAIAAVDYTNRDALAAFLNVYEISNEDDNEKLVDGSDVLSLHNHNGAYYTKSELGAISGGELIGLDDAVWDPALTFGNVQEFVDNLYGYIGDLDLDTAYSNDPDGVMNIDDASKPLDLRSDNVNDIMVSRIDGADYQTAMLFDVSADELVLGSLGVGALSEIDVRVKNNVIIEGNVTITGQLTDTTVDELNITNANIRLRDGATAVPGANAYIEVERGTSGADARLEWDESSDRFLAGTVGDEDTIALLERDELVTGIWEFQGAASSDPNLYFDNKAAAPSTNLGAADQIPLAMINNTLAVYNKNVSKWLSVSRLNVFASGRDSANNTNEYLRIGDFTSNQSSIRLHNNYTLVQMSAQTDGAETWTVRVRKNGSPTNLASLAITAADGAVGTFNVDFNTNDKLEVYCDGSGIDRPFVALVFARRF